MTDCRFLFLGTGGSMGIPVIGCDCPVCSSSSHFNKRWRPSAMITKGNQKIVLDCGPDFRLQALHYKIDTLDGVIFTHAHHDHTAGIDDLRIYTLRSGKPMPCLLSQETLKDLQERYGYIFNENYEGMKLTTNLQTTITPGNEGDINFLGWDIHYVTYVQGGMRVNGLRFGDLAFLTDIREYDSSIFDSLRNLKTLVISALRYTPSHLHFSVDEAVEFAQKVGAEQTWLTHIAHDLDHEETNAYLPANIRLGYDGLEFGFKG